jgi:hypothetical protein
MEQGSIAATRTYRRTGLEQAALAATEQDTVFLSRRPCLSVRLRFSCCRRSPASL